MNKFHFLLIFIVVLITVRLAHCDNLDRILDSLKTESAISDSLKWELEIVEMKKAQIEKLKKELAK